MMKSGAGMNIEKQFQLLGLLRDDGIRTFRAKEIASGRDLQIHIFHSEASENRLLFERLRALPLNARHELLELGYEDKTPYVVTDPLPRETGARAWFGRLLRPVVESAAGDASNFSKVGVWKTAVELPKVDLRGPASEPGEFTKMFQGTPHPQAAPAEPGEFTRMFQPSAVPAQRPATPPPSPEPLGAEPGEFTRMFQPPPAPVQSTAVPTPAAAPPVPAEPGEFTRMFQPPATPGHGIAPPVPSSVTFQPRAAEPVEVTRLFPAQPPAETRAAGAAPPPQAAAEAGEFTRFFQSPMQPEPLPEGLRAADSFGRPGGPPAPHRVGEFTQMFGNPAHQAPPAAPPFGSSSPGQSATRAFAVPVPPPAPRLASQGPGEYTKMMSANAMPTLGQSAPPPPATPAKTRNAMLPLVLSLAVILFFAILIVVFFAMRHR